MVSQEGIGLAGKGSDSLRRLLSHLLITRPSTSNALECFVLERAEESTHSAMLVSCRLFALADHLSDLCSPNRHSGSCRARFVTYRPRVKQIQSHSEFANASSTAATRSSLATHPSHPHPPTGHYQRHRLGQGQSCTYRRYRLRMAPMAATP